MNQLTTVKVSGCSKKNSLLIEKFIMIETDIGEFVVELTLQNFQDYLIYGYNPWDYLKETELNMKHQAFL